MVINFRSCNGEDDNLRMVNDDEDDDLRVVNVVDDGDDDNDDDKRGCVSSGRANEPNKATVQIVTI